MKNRELMTMHQALERAGMVSASPKFAFWVARNKRALKPVVEALQEASRPPGEAAAFEEARAELARSLADPAGPSPEMTGGAVRLRDRKAYDDGVRRLHAQFPRAARLLEDHAAKFDKLLDEEAADPPRLSTIRYEHLPPDLTGNVLDALFDLVESDDTPPARPRPPADKPD